MNGLVDPHSVTLADIEKVAIERDRIHQGHDTYRPFSENYSLIGLLGEWEFAKQFYLPLDLTTRPEGDGHVDFEISGKTIDIKTALKPVYLFRERGKHLADILVLAHCFEENKIRLVGWENDYVLRECPYRDFGYGVENHYKHASKLKKINALKYFLSEGMIWAL